MIRSMTAFARRELEGPWGQLTWELRSVNHRYLEVTVRLPEDLRSLEPKVRERAGQRLGRGKLECNLRFRPAALQSTDIELDAEALRQVVGAAGTVADAVANPAAINPLELLRWPGVVKEPEKDTAPILEQALELLDQALTELVETREREGAQIRELLATRCDAMAGLVADQRARMPGVRDKVRDKLLAKLAELQAQPDQDRLEQELVYLAQKMDVDEELDRLDGHITEVRRVLERDEPVGRRLDFLMQEFNREANTLGSKSADPDTTRTAVELKVLIEQMREQVQNAE